MTHADALILAEVAWNTLRPFCDRLLIAGSIRRLRPEVKDIELVCVPRQVAGGLFGDVLEVDPGFLAAVRQWRKIKGEPTGRYTQRVLPGGMVFDLFMAQPDTWGWQLCLRTGSAGFNQHVLLRAMRQQGYTSEDGGLTRQGVKISTSEETDVFRLLRFPDLGVAKVNFLAKEAVSFSYNGAMRRNGASFVLFSLAEMGHRAILLRLSAVLRNAVVMCRPYITPDNCWHKTTWPEFQPSLPPGLLP